MLEERRHLDAEGPGDLLELQHGDVAHAPLQAVRIRPVDAGLGGEPFLIPALGFAESADAPAETFEGRVRGVAGWHAA